MQHKKVVRKLYAQYSFPNQKNVTAYNANVKQSDFLKVQKCNFSQYCGYTHFFVTVMFLSSYYRVGQENTYDSGMWNVLKFWLVMVTSAKTEKNKRWSTRQRQVRLLINLSNVYMEIKFKCSPHLLSMLSKCHCLPQAFKLICNWL